RVGVDRPDYVAFLDVRVGGRRDLLDAHDQRALYFGLDPLHLPRLRRELLDLDPDLAGGTAVLRAELPGLLVLGALVLALGQRRGLRGLLACAAPRQLRLAAGSLAGHVADQVARVLDRNG